MPFDDKRWRVGIVTPKEVGSWLLAICQFSEGLTKINYQSRANRQYSKLDLGLRIDENLALEIRSVYICKFCLTDLVLLDPRLFADFCAYGTQNS